MKKLVLFVLAFALILSFAGCKKEESAAEENPFEGEEVLFDIAVDGDLSSSADSDASNSEESDSSEESQESSKDESGSSDDKKTGGTGLELVKADGYYFPDIDQLYEPAAKIYYEITSGNLPVDWDMGRYEFTVDGSTNTYWRISDSRFDSVEELEKYLHAYFTEDFVKTFYNSSLFYDYEGHLYAVTGVSGENVLFAGCEFKLTKQTTRRVFFSCTSYFYKSLEDVPAERTTFEKAPEDTSKFNTKTVEFVLESDESGYNWRFSKFENIK